MFFKYCNYIINSDHVNYVETNKEDLIIYIYMTNKDYIECKCKNLDAMNKAFDLLLYRLNKTKEK